jgi:hypothetical protein
MLATTLFAHSSTFFFDPFVPECIEPECSWAGNSIAAAELAKKLAPEQLDAFLFSDCSGNA